MRTCADELIAAGSPSHLSAIFRALHFKKPSARQLRQLSAEELPRLLWWCDTRQLTLLLGEMCGPALPEELQLQVSQRAAKYAIRFDTLKRDLFEIAGAFNASNLDFVLLKGISHAPALTPRAELRAQGDIDFWLKPDSVYTARDVLAELGYVPVLKSKSRHLAPMAKPSNWRWQGDLFDPEIPISVELHYELWSETAEHIRIPDIEQFWDRRIIRQFDGHRIHVLSEEDMLGFAALHLLLHVLHGDLPLQRAWEIARFLDVRAEDEGFWESWRKLHSPKLRQLEIPVYDLVRRWFGCRWPERLDAEVRVLPQNVKLWLERFPLAPLVREWSPNKSELWLNLALVDGRIKQARVFMRRLTPHSLPSIPNASMKTGGLAIRLRAYLRFSTFIAQRMTRHFITFFPTIADGIRLALKRP